MKKLLGTDFQGTYLFKTASNTISFSNLETPITLANILLITNVTANTIIYNFADSTKGAVSFNGTDLVLDYNTSSMASTDILQIYVDTPGSDTTLLRSIKTSMQSPPGYDKASGRYKDTVILESGTVTTVNTVTTCSTLSNITSIGGLSAERLLYNQNATAWQVTIRARIT